MQSRMIEELVQSLEHFRLKASVDEGYLPLDHIGQHMTAGGSRAALSRLTNPADETKCSRDVDGLVAAYAIETGVTPMQIWDKARSAWEADPDGETYATRRRSTHALLEDLRHEAMFAPESSP